MRIAHVFKDFYPPLAAGITRYIADLAEATAARGHEVEVHVAGVHRSRRDMFASGVIVHRHRELCRALSMPLSPGLVREVRSLDVDVLHVHMPNPIGELGALLNERTPVVCSFHAQLGRQRFLEPFYGPLRRGLLAKASCVLTSGLAMSQVSELATCRPKVRILPYGVSPHLVPRSRTQKKQTGDLRLLFVGRLVYYKGVEMAISAVAKAPGVTLTIVGDGPHRPQLEAQSYKLGTTRQVRFLGAISDEDLLQVYAASDVFVLPSISRAESFGIAMIEAMANGIPAISTAVGTETDRVNVHGLTGLVVAPGDIEALGHAIESLSEPTLRERLAANAYDRAQHAFSFANHLDTVESTYVEAIQ